VDPLVIVLRLVHVVSGALWVGMLAFSVFYLMPAIQEVGPDGGKVMAAFQKRGLMTVMPLLALGALISGFWLYTRAGAGMPAEFGRSPVGMAFGLGGLAALVAWLLGIAVMRPSMMKAMALGQSLGPSTSADERQRVMGEAQRLRGRAAAAGRATAYLLLFAVAAMAVARYL
jgi:putative copper export protein